MRSSWRLVVLFWLGLSFCSNRQQILDACGTDWARFAAGSVASIAVGSAQQKNSFPAPYLNVGDGTARPAIGSVLGGVSVGEDHLIFGGDLLDF